VVSEGVSKPEVPQLKLAFVEERRLELQQGHWRQATRGDYSHRTLPWLELVMLRSVEQGSVVQLPLFQCSLKERIHTLHPVQQVSSQDLMCRKLLAAILPGKKVLRPSVAYIRRGLSHAESGWPIHKY
jgi:hypothetical protein